jgi:baculoviral IAP repeat-containing protein 6 (apollon)
LQENARVDLESSTPNYHATELLITRLSALTGVQPIDPTVSPDIVYSFNAEGLENIGGDYFFEYPGNANSGSENEHKHQTQQAIPIENEANTLENTPSPANKKLRTVIHRTEPEAAGMGPAITSIEETLNPASHPIEIEEEVVEVIDLTQDEEEPSEPTSGQAAPAIAWNKGVGYGMGSSNKNRKVWDATRAEKLQEARDAELYDVLSSLAEAAQKVLGSSENGIEGEEAMTEEEKEENGMPCENEDEKKLILTVLKSGCLVPFLTKELSSAGFQGMASRAAYYRALLQCVQVFCLHSDIASMLCWHAENDLKSLATAVSSLKAQASTFFKVVGDEATGSEPEQEYRLATLILTVAEQVEKIASDVPLNAINIPLPAAATAAADGGASTSKTTAAAAAAAAAATTSNITIMPAEETLISSAPSSELEIESRYVSIMSPYKVALLPGIATNHIFQSHASKEPTAATRQRARRVASELASLESDSPITTSSSVFVCADEQQTVLWKALITGPKDTPYESGCFLFDIYFPSDYPDKAPSVRIRTTGGGTVRFNPNLYDCGKVCLSLLGTWRGEKGESWSAEYSSILQVLISIQSLIFVDQPFYNEPGYESRVDDAASNAYSAEIMAHTVKWAMLDQLQSPPEYFAEAIKCHFRDRGEAVLATVRRWENWCSKIGAKMPAKAINKMLPELENEIAKLKNV